MSTSALQQFVTGLKSQNADARGKSARDLCLYIKTELREVPPETATAFMNKLNEHILKMVSSGDANEKKGGILAILCVVSTEAWNVNTGARFANILRNHLPFGDPVAIEMAARTMGKIALVSGSNAAQYVEFEVERAFEYLDRDRNEAKRHAAVLILRELALAMPTYFYRRASPFLEKIFVAMRDPRAVVREGAADALGAALVATARRESARDANAPQRYRRCYDEAVSLLDDAGTRTERGTTRDDRAHGALLVLNELMRCADAKSEMHSTRLLEACGIARNGRPHAEDDAGTIMDEENTESDEYSPSATLYESTVCRRLIGERYAFICSDALAQRTSRSPHVQHALLALLPRLAAFDNERFARDHAAAAFQHAVALVKGREKERAAAFVCVGLLAIALGEAAKPHLPKILDAIYGALPGRETPNKKRGPQTPEPAAFACIALLAHADILSTNSARDLVEPMLGGGLSTPLTTALNELAKKVPAIRGDVADALLKMLALVLLERPLRHPGVPRHIRPPGAIGLITGEIPDVNRIALALRTLGTFDFDGRSLLEFLRRCAEHFIESERADIRLEAVRTSARLLRSALAGPPSRTVARTAADVLARLLRLAVTDSDPEVRLGALASLDDSFDPHLAQAEALATLFIALHDEAFEVRELALRTVGRLSASNPAYAMPALRKTLVQLLTELEHSGVARNKEQAARLLGALVVSAPRLARPYAEPVLAALAPKLRDSEPVALAATRAIGELADAAGGAELLPRADELLGALLEPLGDAASPERRATALWALGRIVAATGHALGPRSKRTALLDALLGLLRTEQRQGARRETLRVLGLLGALDPYARRDARVASDANAAPSAAAEPSPAPPEQMSGSELLVTTGSSGGLDEYYTTVAVSTLVRIARDPTLAQHHTMVVQSLTFVFGSLGIKCVQYVPRVLPSFLAVIRAAEPGAREFLLQQLATLIGTVKQHVRNHLDEIFALVDELWTPGGALRGTLVYVTERVAVALGAEFKAYVPRLVPHVLRALAPDPGGADDAVALKTLEALHEFGGALDDHLHLVLPAVVRLFDAPDAPTPVRLAALRTVERLADTLDVADFASRLVRPLLRAIESTDDGVQRAAIDALCTVAERLGRRYEPFVKPAAMTLDRKKISSSRHDAACARATSASTLAEPSRPTPRPPAHDVVLASADAGAIRKLNVSAPNLRDAWTATRRVSRDDWLEWLVGLSMALIKESPSPALRSCLGLAQSYAQLPRELFDAAFASCWAELGEPMRRELVASLESALAAPDAPEVAHAVLNLAEFMERCDHGPLPLDAATLGERATRCRAYAKALHYEEAAFRAGAGARAVEALILINNELRQSEAAHGLLEHATARGDAAQARWYERLRGWQTALELYEARPPDDEEARLGRLRCLEALGEWGALHDAAEESWPTLDENARREAGRPAAAAAWALGRWERMESFVACVPSDTQDGAFLRAVLDVHAGRYASARRLVDTARDLLDAELTATASESYVRAYGAMVRAQMLAELEEVVQYKLVPERRPAIRATWWQRLQAGRRVADDWQRILRVRSLVLSPQEDVHTWLKYASLCRKSGSLTLSHKTLVMLMGVDPSLNPDEALPGTQPRVTLAYAKHLWVGGERELAFERLGEFVRSYATRPGLDARLLARCYRKLGEWQESLRGVTERSIPDVLRWYMAATQHYSNCYKAWHAWAYANFETVLFYERERREIEGEERPSISTTRFAVAAVEGFFRSINLLSGGGSSLQDTLRLLTLWFDYGHITEVYDAIEGGVRVVDINTWLQVIPQLIARIDTPQLPVGRLIHRLLIDIGKSHPQALVYPLTVASKSASPARRAAADKILQSVREHSPTLVAQAVLVSDELIRVAILWHELWHEGLEEASRLYFGERDVRGMLATLEPLHAMLERGPQTLKETSFHQAYGRDLQEAREWCARYRASSDVQDLNQAWDLYYHVFRRISRQLPQLTTLELQYVSPKLLLCRDLELAVPGSYSPGARVVRIAHVGGNLQVIASKQRPRKLLVRGDDGREYAFLLKGHEDLRQDERVMQLFGLVDALLARDPAGRGRDLSIRRYAVVPLSTNSGLIGWVPHCDTLHALVRDYREKKRILLNIEHRIMLRMAPDYDRLPLANKVEVFEHALEHTHGDDLARLMWLKSPSSEAWFDRRCNYTRSLAVMSMVGYVLGLGDRHPSNLMLDRLGGKILHIDFGDCFEVAMTREKFPEKIPFRLTRMLVNAMEVTGIEGTYRHTCEIVMAALRRNRDSLMAVLEAFVYDPLLNWRLVDAAGGGARRSRDTVAANSLSGALGSRDATVAAPLGSPILTPPGATVAAVDDGAIITDESARRRRPEALSRKALAIVDRVRDKLTGRDFSHEDALTVERQVDLLIRQATSNENLCQCYIGWCPFW